MMEILTSTSLARLWPNVKPHIDELITEAEQRIAQSEENAMRSIQAAIAAANTN
jgi:hypothetical protein